MAESPKYPLLLFVIFAVCCCGAGSGDLVIRVHPKQRFSIVCKSKGSKEVGYIEFIKISQHKGIEQDGQVILRYSVTDNKTTYLKKTYQNEFYTELINSKPLSLVVGFHSPKMSHSGTYRCAYRDKQQHVIPTPDWKKLVVVVFDSQFKITRCKHGENVELVCEGINLEAKPTRAVFLVNEFELEIPVYSNISEREGRYYDITVNAVVPLSEIGGLPAHVTCQVSISEGTSLETSVHLTNQRLLEDKAIQCLPNLRMDEHEIWEEVGQRNTTLRCTFDIPQENKLTKIEWSYLHSTKNRLMFSWTKESGQHAESEYKSKTFASIAPVEFKGRTATSVTFKMAMLSLAGKYTCKVFFEKSTQSDSALLVVYQLRPPNFTAIGCSNRKVRLECNANEVHPRPEGIELTLYHPKSNLSSKLGNTSDVKEVNGTYEITAEMVASIDQVSVDASPDIMCIVVLSKKRKILKTSWTNRKRYVTDSRGNTRDVCSAKVEMEPRLQWKEAGSTEVSMRCYFEIPQNDEIESIEWLHNEFDDQTPFYSWEKRRNNSGSFRRYKDQIVNSSSLIPHVHGSGNSSTLQFKNATFDYEGKYLCRVNYTIAGPHEDNTTLVVYELSKPDYFKATRCSDNQTVGLECKASNVRPRPIEVAFYVYDPRDNSSARLDTDVYIDIAETNESFAINARMIARIQWSRKKNLRAKCEVILHDNISKSESTDLADPDTPENSECSPNLRADNHRLWQKVGEDVVLRCTFNIPFRRRISSVEWIRHDISGALFKWEANGNRTKVRLNMLFALTQDPGGRNVTTLTIESADIEHSGNYTCRINFGSPNSSQSDTSLLVVYWLSRLDFTAVGCNDEKVRLECMADSVHPAPLEVAFFFYDPRNDSLLKLNSTVPPKRRNEVNGFYNVTAKMFTLLDRHMADEMSPTFMCRMVLSWDPLIVARSFAARTTFVVDFRGVHVDVCSPKVMMEPHLQWVKFGTSPEEIRCRFAVPLNDEIESIEWFHQNTSALFNLSQPEGKITNVSLISQGDKFWTLKLDEAKIKYNGSYLCRVNYVLAGNPSGYGHLVVYRIEKPYHFETIYYGEGEAILHCKAGNLFPKPKKIVFFKYDPISKLKTMFIQKSVNYIFEVNRFYNINAHMAIETGESESVQYVCEVVLSEDPKIEESTLLSPPTTTTLYYTPDDYDKPNITGKGEILPKYVIIGGSIGGLLLGSCLAYLLYAYICKRLCHAWQDESSKEKKKKKQ